METRVTAAVAGNFNDAEWLSVLARLAGGDALSLASPPSVSACNDAAASDINSHTWPYAAKRSDFGNNSHDFVAGSKTVPVTNGCEAASALLSAKRSSRAAHRSGLKWAMVGSRSCTQPVHASQALLLVGK